MCSAHSMQNHRISWGTGSLTRHSRTDKSVIERVRKARENMAAAGQPYGEANVSFPEEQAA